MQNEKQKEHMWQCSHLCVVLPTTLYYLHWTQQLRASIYIYIYIIRQFVETAEPKERIKTYEIKMKWRKEKKEKKERKKTLKL